MATGDSGFGQVKTQSLVCENKINMINNNNIKVTLKNLEETSNQELTNLLEKELGEMVLVDSYLIESNNSNFQSYNSTDSDWITLTIQLVQSGGLALVVKGVLDILKSYVKSRNAEVTIEIDEKKIKFPKSVTSDDIEKYIKLLTQKKRPPSKKKAKND